MPKLHDTFYFPLYWTKKKKEASFFAIKEKRVLFPLKLIQ